MIKAIQTQYKGYNFRSRLEARWAVFFDALGLKWEYEPEGFELPGGQRYLPDFRVTYPGRWAEEQHTHWFEVKSDLALVTQDEWSKLLAFSESSELTILDGTPGMRMYVNADDCLAEDGSLKSWVLKHKREGLSLWCSRGRMWSDGHDEFFECDARTNAILQRACDAARSARFEFGQSGASK